MACFLKRIVVLRFYGNILRSRTLSLSSNAAELSVTSKIQSLHYEAASTSLVEEPKVNSTPIFDKRKLLRTNSLSSVLSIATSLTKPGDICIVLEHVANLRKRNMISHAQLNDMPDSKEFFQFIKKLDYVVLTLHPLQLTRALRSLLYLHHEDNSVIASLENHVLWLASKMTFSELVQIALVHQSHQETKLRQSIYKQLLEHINRRISELSTVNDLVSVLYLNSTAMPDLLKAIEEKLINMCSQMSTKDCCRVFYLLGKQKRRNLPVLLALASQLSTQQMDFDLVHLSNLAFACASLNYYHEVLFENMSRNVSKFVTVTGEKPACDAVQLGLLISILQSFSAMRFRKPELLDKLASSIIAGGSDEDKVSLLQSCAALNYSPAAVQADVGRLAQQLGHLQHSNPKQWLTFVSSLTVLNLLTADLVASVLNKDFIAKLSDGGEVASKIHLQLVNINAAAKCDLPHYSGYLLPDSYLKDHNVTVPLKTHRPLLNTILLPLITMFPQERYLQFATVTNGAYVIDIEMIVNSKGEAQPLAGAAALGSKGKNYRRVAIRVLDYADMTRGDACVPVGIQALANRHLASQGYAVVQIPYKEVASGVKLAQLAQYLQGKIRAAVKA